VQQRALLPRVHLAQQRWCQEPSVPQQGQCCRILRLQHRVTNALQAAQRVATGEQEPQALQDAREEAAVRIVGQVAQPDGPMEMWRGPRQLIGRYVRHDDDHRAPGAASPHAAATWWACGNSPRRPACQHELKRGHDTWAVQGCSDGLLRLNVQRWLAGLRECDHDVVAAPTERDQGQEAF